MPLRIGMLMDHPSPHMVSLLEAVTSRNDCTLEVLYCGRNAPGRNWGTPVGNIPHQYSAGVAGPLGTRFNPGILRAMNRLHTDIWVINTVYGSPTTLMAAQWLHFHDKPWVYMNEPVRPRPGFPATLRELPLSVILNKADGIIGTGKAAVDLYRRRLRNDLPSESIPYCIDISEFFALPDPAPPAEGEDFRFLSSGQFIKRKGFGCLLEACKSLPRSGWHLTLIGDGPLRSWLERTVERYGLAGRISLKESIPYSQRAKIYAGRQVFIFPSLWDGWGMVVPEALASGLPVVSSDHVMSAHEFIREGRNGFVVPVGNSEALAEKMQWFLGNRSLYPEMSRAARKALEDYRPEAGAEKLVCFLRNLSDRMVKRQRARNDPPDTAKLTWNSLIKPPNALARSRAGIRSFARKAIIQGSVAACRPTKPKGHAILAYHLVLKEDRQNFENHLKFFGDHYRVCSMRELLQTVASGKNGDFRLAITFDDGFHLLMQDCLEMLEKHRIKAGFYVPAAFIDSKLRNRYAEEFSTKSFYYRRPLEPMDPADLQQLAALGHEVGSHGLYHTDIHSLTPESAERELNLSRSLISRWTGVDPAGYAYPYGRTANSWGNPAEWLQSAGFVFGLTLARGTVDVSTNPYALPRHHAEGNWPVQHLRYFLFQ